MGQATTQMTCGFCGECVACVTRMQRGGKVAHEVTESAKRLNEWKARRDAHWAGIVARIMGAVAE